MAQFWETGAIDGTGFDFRSQGNGPATLSRIRRNQRYSAEAVSILADADGTPNLYFNAAHLYDARTLDSLAAGAELGDYRGIPRPGLPFGYSYFQPLNAPRPPAMPTSSTSSMG